MGRGSVGLLVKTHTAILTDACVTSLGQTSIKRTKPGLSFQL